MNVSFEKQDVVSAIMTINIEAADYESQLKEALKGYAKKAQMPGFRPGKVPVGLVKKMYGTQAKAEEVNKVLSKALYDYIRENDVQVLGEPMVSEKQGEVDMENSNDFTFVFDIAIAPEFKAELSADDKITYYDIDITDEQIDAQVKGYAQQAGAPQNVESYEDRDILRGALAEQDENGAPKENGVNVDKASLMPAYFKNDEQKAIFENAKVGDVITFNPTKAYDGNETEIAALLKVEKDQVAQYAGEFTFQVEEISRFVPAEVNQELFDRVFGEGEVKDEADFRARIKAQLEEMHVADSDYKFLVDVRAYCEEKVGELQMPEAILKRFLTEQNKDKEISDEDFSKSMIELKWHLIKEQLVKQTEVKVDNDDVKKQAVNAARFQFAQYGMNNIPEEYLVQYADKMMEDRNQVNALVERCIDDKLTAALKNIVTLDHKSIGVEDFAKMFEEEK